MEPFEQEQKLKIQNTILQSTIESYSDVLIFSIDREYRYLIFNHAFKTATAAAYGTIVSEGVSMLDSITGAEDRAKAKANCDRAFAGESHMTLEVYGDLDRFYFETRYSPVLNETGGVIGVTVMSGNVTERKRAEEQLQQINKELEFFSYSVSHDLRAPLRSINGYATILQEDFGSQLNEDGRRTLDSICRNARKMGDLIDDLLTFSHLGRKDIIRKRVNMNELVRSVISELYDGDHPPKAQIQIEGLLPATGDYSLLKQVWVNLISNALKYSSTKPEPFIHISCSYTDTLVTYRIQDNGVGFDMAYYDKLFGVFQRLHSDREFSGTGVGLAIVQRIVKRHNGEVWAEAGVGTGATFYVTLPAVKEE